MAGKGDSYRKVNWKAWSEGYDRIFGKKESQSTAIKEGVMHPKTNTDVETNSGESTQHTIQSKE